MKNAPIDAADVFKATDFQSIRLKVYFINNTTHTEANSEHCTLEEMGDKILTFGIPAKSCNTKHNVMCSIRKIDPGSKHETEIFSFTGKVKAIELLEDVETIGIEEEVEIVRVVIECLQYDEESWKALEKIFSTRQDEINEFLKSARGY
jgi:hypothetical protein